MAGDDAATGGSRLFTVRMWTEPAAYGIPQRGSVRDVATGAFRNFQEWSDLIAFLAEQLEEGRSIKEEPDGEGICRHGGRRPLCGLAHRDVARPQGLPGLAVDKASFPSDSLSTHYIHQPGVACLERWGLPPEIARSKCPPIRTGTLDLGPFALEISPPPYGEVADAYCVRRTILDDILLRAAGDAGAEVRQRFTVNELVTYGDRVAGIRGHAGGRARPSPRRHGS